MWTKHSIRVAADRRDVPSDVIRVRPEVSAGSRPPAAAANATAESRTAVASAAVSVRSGARTTIENASDLRPAET